MHGFSAGAGAFWRFAGFAGFLGIAVRGVAANATRGGRRIIQTTEVDDHEQKPLGVWTLALFSANPK
ncbi:hypothetical protein D3C71_1938170 [compost metagenome]